MANNGNRIYIGTTGVEIADIQTVLGLSNNDIGALITQGASQGIINKWAKFKPIRYYIYDPSTQTKTPYPGLLTGDMWKGVQIDHTNYGMYYGIIVRVPSVDQQLNTWPILHGATFEYCPPRGLVQSEFFRVRDFEGYCQNATPNPFASFGSDGEAVGFVNHAGGIAGIAVRYYDPVNGNPDGVDLTDILLGPSDSSLAVLADTYPCIIIGKGNTHYVTALGYEDDPNHAPRPLYYNNAFLGGTWVVDTNKTVYDTHPFVPWTSPESGLSATIALLRSAKSGGIYLDSAGTQDLSQHWFDCSSGSSITALYKPVPLPGAVGIDLSLVTYQNAFKVTPTGVVSADANTVSVNFEITYAGSETMPLGSAVVSAHVGHNGAYGGTWKDVTMLLRGSATTTKNIIFNATDFDMQMFMPNTTYSIEINTSASPGEPGYGEFPFTVN